jgi:cation diffusion facilitator family transporter
LISAFLAAVKIVSGIIGHSYALIADGVESVMDIFSALVVWGSLRVAAKPPDSNHPYGHGRAESLGAMVVALGLLGAALGIAIQSIHEIITPHRAPASFTLFILAGVVITKEILYRILRRTGIEIASSAVRADAWHHRSDALTSLAAFVGISVSLLGGPGYEAADDWAALFACLVIAFNGIRLLRTTLDDVMDAAAPDEVVQKVRRIAGSVADVEHIDKCRVRRSGLSLLVEVHVVVDGELPVRRGHDIAHAVKATLIASRLGILDVAVHIEPSESHAP